MNRKNNHSTDGFIPRRPQRSNVGETSSPTQQIGANLGRSSELETAELHTTGSDKKVQHLKTAHKVNTLEQSINESLSSIEDDKKQEKVAKKKQRKKKFWVKIVLWALGAILAAVIGFLLYRAWNMVSSVFKGDVLGIFQQQELKMDAGGRSNVLILGSTDDMADRDGANLTDSMMVLSVDQKKKDAYMFSVPRDLWVKYGTPCFWGNEGKINAYYSCAGDEAESDTSKMDDTRKLVGNLFGMDIQYVVHVNTVVIRDGVNAVGGITVNVDGTDPRGVLDATFDDMCKNQSNLCPTGHFMQFKNGANEMNGDQAMAFSQARGMGVPSYGLDGSNFAREKNQQLVLMALKDKATSSGTLTDITKITALIDAMGNNLRTNIDAKEIRTVMSVASEIKDSDIHRLTFVDEDDPLMTTGSSADGQSIVRPVAGIYDYSQIKAYLKKTIYATDLTRENANIIVVNATETSGVAGKETQKLADLGLNVEEPTNTEAGNYGNYKVYKLVASDKMPLTQSKLEELYKTKAVLDKPPFEVPTGVDFVVVIGAIIE